MAIVNRTPNSFYDRGATFAATAAVAAAEHALDAGAAIVDIGGVKAGEGAPVSQQQTAVGERFERVRAGPARARRPR